ncbi:Transmembrane protein 53 [Cocos nucifera]|uniref:Transmembrane protein 53 n=1 Tax=Cocos nucifera TaxID=13894 RepID=A0A8K0ISN7_COCNU|nr:Transmembrane protein 53 [Cocos nucifera]
MWGDGGRFYWARRGRMGRENVEGVVVVFAWLSSEERHLKPYIDLYWSLGWSCLICHSDFLTLFFPENATSLACSVLNELVKEVRYRPLPIVLVAFSGGSKGFMYKVLQLLEGKCDGQLSLDEYQLVRDCICGQIYDSSPVDFTSDVGTRLFLHPTVVKMFHPPRIVSWMAKALASGLDTLFLGRFEAQRAEYWQTLYSSVSMGPFLILYSEDDDVVPYQIISSFAQHLQELGGNVKLVKWNNSCHVAHYKYHQAEYKDAVSEMLVGATITYCERRRLNGETLGIGGACGTIPESICSLPRAAACSSETLRMVANDPSDQFFLPSSMEPNETKDTASLLDEQKAELFQLPSINPHGILGQILYDVCVPKNIEGWDIKPVLSINGRRMHASACRHGPFNRIRYIRRCRL